MQILTSPAVQWTAGVAAALAAIALILVLVTMARRSPTASLSDVAHRGGCLVLTLALGAIAASVAFVVWAAW